jgi:hypothetical protein
MTKSGCRPTSWPKGNQMANLIQSIIGVEVRAVKTKSYEKVGDPDFYAISLWDKGNPDVTAVVVKKSALEDEMKLLKKQLSLMPLTDAEKIAWAEDNHPLYSMRKNLQERLNLIKEYLANM